MTGPQTQGLKLMLDCDPADRLIILTLNASGFLPQGARRTDPDIGLRLYDSPWSMLQSVGPSYTDQHAEVWSHYVDLVVGCGLITRGVCGSRADD